MTQTISIPSRSASSGARSSRSRWRSERRCTGPRTPSRRARGRTSRLPSSIRRADGGAGAVQPRPHGRDVLRGPQRARRASGRDAPAGRRDPPQRSAARLGASARLLHHPAGVPRGPRWSASRSTSSTTPTSAGSGPGSQGVEGIFDYFQEGLRIPPTKVWTEYEEQRGHRRHHRRQHAHAGEGAGRSARAAQRAARGGAAAGGAGRPLRSRDALGGHGRDRRAHRGQHARGDPRDPGRHLHLRGLPRRLGPGHRRRCA